MRKNRPGITARIGIIIIAVAVVVVGVAIYFVYKNTSTSEQKKLSITLESNPILFVQGATVTVPVTITTSNTTDSIVFSLSSSSDISATLTSTSINPAGSTSLVLTGSTLTQSASVQISATQGTQSATASAQVKVVQGATNTNANTNAQTNQNTNTNAAVNANTNTNANTNAATGLTEYFSQDFKMTLKYPSSWGTLKKAALVHLAPTQGAMVYGYFSNLSRFDLAGNIFFTAVSANYIPHDFSGTPQWFATTFTPLGSTEQIAKEVLDAGLRAYDIQKVTIDGKPAIRILYLRGFYNNFLDVAYVIFNNTLTATPNMLLSMSIDFVKGENDFTDVNDADMNAIVAKVKARTLSDQAMRRLDQFEAMIKTIQFTQ